MCGNSRALPWPEAHASSREWRKGRYIEGVDRTRALLFPRRLDDWGDEDSTLRVIDVFVDELYFAGLGFERAAPANTGRPAYHPGTLLSMYINGYLNRIHSSRRLEIEAHCSIELVWLTGRLAPDFKTIADFRRDNGPAIREVCREFVLLCHRMRLLEHGIVATDSSTFKAVNNRNKNFTERKLQARMQQFEESPATATRTLSPSQRTSAVRSNRRSIPRRMETARQTAGERTS